MPPLRHLLPVCLALLLPLGALRAADAPVPAAAPVASESEAETVAKCLADLRAPQVERRHRAVLLLSKYRVPEARQALARALDDEAPVIRLAALVALAEERLDPLAAPKVLPLLADPDPAVRRLASYHLGTAAMYFGEDLPAGGRALLQRAFADPDLTVRKNLLQAFPMLAHWLPVSVLAKLLADPDRGLRSSALEQVLTHPQARELAPQIAPLATDPDRLIRLRLAQLVTLLGPESAAPLLTQLSADQDLEVATTARLMVCRQTPTLAGWQELRAALEVPALPAPLVGQIVGLAPVLGDPAEALLRGLLAHPRSEVRVEALRILAIVLRGRPDLAPFLAALADSDLKVRADAARLLQGRRQALTVAQLTALTTSKHADVRAAAIGLTEGLPPADAAPLVLDLLLDDAVAVRGAAILQLGRRHLPGWQAALGDSLRDPDVAIALQAVDACAQAHAPEAVQLLQDAAKTLKDPRVLQAIDLALHPPVNSMRLPDGTRIFIAPQQP